MFLHTSSNLFELSVVYSFNMSANMNLANPVYSSSPISLFIILSTGLFSIVKAYSTGIDICHTTNILSFRFWYYIVQWIKPPSLLFPNLYLTYIWNIIFYNPLKNGWHISFIICVSIFQESLSRQDSFLDFLWIDYIISSVFLFVNTIFNFLFY